MNTLFTGRTLIELHETTSTNTHATQLIKQGQVVEGTIVWAHFQTFGRGQYGNTWQSDEGKNLTFSLVLHPNFLSAEKQFYLSKITSLAVLGMLTEYLPSSQYDIQIKWPNDILVNKHKVAGILIESILRGNHLQSSVIGVGINVNQEVFEGLNKAVSLRQLTEKKQDLKALLELFCKHFEAQYLSLKHNHFEQINKMYLQNLYQFNEMALYRAGGVIFEAKITGLEESGILILDSEKQKKLKLNFKEIEFL